MLLSVFAYAHFVNIAGPDARKKLAEQSAPAPRIHAAFEYKVTDFFEDNSAMLTDYARAEIARIPNIREKQLLTIYVPVVAQMPGGQRLRQWEKVAARSAAIADAFERAGQDGEMISLKIPEKLVSKAGGKPNIMLTFLPPKSDVTDE